ncbi:MAG: rod shape-determining protein MreD [Clostridia bacterium]|nr:rod shape-determining protein MreD [Clostridia bacterium]
MPKSLRILLLILTAYILQTVILPRFTMLGMQPDVLLAVLVWLTADGDRYLGFCTGAVMGLIMDAMVGQLPFLYLLAYPIMGYASARLTPAIVRRLPLPKRQGKRLPLAFLYRYVPLITAAAMALLYEFALMVYRYLSGVDLTLAILGRMLQFVLYSTIAAFFARFPVRFVMTAGKGRGRGKNDSMAQA